MKGGKGGGVQYGDHTSLVDEIKDRQRNDEGFKEAWKVYCQSHGTSKMDPNKYDEVFLAAALKELTRGGKGKGGPKGGKGGGGSVGGKGGGGGKKGGSQGGYPDHSDYGGSRGAYGSANGYHGYLPMDEAAPAGGGGGGGGGGKAGDQLPHDLESLITIVKERQRALPGWKSAWWHYCDAHGGGDKDPARHNPKYLRKALRVLSDPTPAWDGNHEALEQERLALVDEVKKRQRDMVGFRHYWIEFCQSNGVGGMDPTRHDIEFLRRGLLPPQVNHMELVDAVKDFQRTCPGFKEEWVEYCNGRGMGVRDPVRHPPEFLTVALRELAGGKGLRGIPVRPARGMQSLVDSVKQLQRETPETRERWIEFCGRWGSSDLDPARHTADFLQQSINFMKTGVSGNKAPEMEEMWEKLKSAAAADDDALNKVAAPRSHSHRA